MAEVATVKKGDKVTVTGAEVEGYTPVRTVDEERGWIKTSDISKERTEIKPQTVPFKVKVTENFAIFLKGVHTEIYPGEVLTIVEIDNSRNYYITYKGIKQYVSGALIRENTVQVK